MTSIPTISCDEENADCPIDVLPDELMIEIFSYLPLESVVTCEEVCSRWRRVAKDPAVWRRIECFYSAKPGDNGVMSARNLKALETHGELVHRLKVQYVCSYGFIKSIFNHCDNLNSLELIMCRIRRDFEEDITRWGKLKKINLKNSLFLPVNADILIQYDQFQGLKYLALSDFGLNPLNCATLLQCKHLKHIFIEKIKGLSLEYIRELITCQQHIVESLHIYGGDSVDDGTVQLISKCPVLKDLAIIRCESLTDKGLCSLSNLDQIVHLQIWNNSNFTEKKLLKTLESPSLVTLHSLSLSRIENISPAIVDLISEYYKNLKFLAVYQCPKIINTDYEKQLKAKFRNIDVVLY